MGVLVERPRWRRNSVSVPAPGGRPNRCAEQAGSRARERVTVDLWPQTGRATALPHAHFRPAIACVAARGRAGDGTAASGGATGGRGVSGWQDGSEQRGGRAAGAGGGAAAAGVRMVESPQTLNGQPAIHPTCTNRSSSC